MKSKSTQTRLSIWSRLLMIVATIASLSAVTHAQTSSVVISQVYGGGGNSSATYTHDYVELFNGSSAPVSLNGWSVQYASATGTTWLVTALTNTTLSPGQYYLVRLASGGAVGSALPAFDVSGTTNMSATAGKVALVNSTTALSGTCPIVGVIDFVGFGTTANCFEGAASAPAPSNVNAVIRAANGCTDSNNNSTDFATGILTPRNTASALNPCTAPCTAPFFTTCPTPISANTGAGNTTCGVAVNYTVAASGTAPVTYSYSFSGATSGNGSGSGSGSIFSAGVTNVTVTASNACGTATCSFAVTVVDNTPPTAVCQNITVNLDPNGNATITPAQVNNGSTDNCGAANPVSVTPNTFNCSNLSLAAPAGDLFISEYIEGSSNNKCIEIFNGTGSAVNLATGGYQLLFYFNGSTTAGLTISLNGTVAAGDVYVVCQATAAAQFLAEADQTNSSGWYNGDDAIVLRKGGSTVLDIIGRIGEDPGTEWGTGFNSTADNTITRNSNIATGVSINPASGFPTLSTEWTGFANDYSSGLGSHTFTPPPAPTAVTLTVSDASGNTSTCIAQVTIVDNFPPVITTCAPDLNVNLNNTCQLTVPDLIAQTTATDNCAVTLTQSPAAGTVIPSGHNQTTVVTITATDASGNSATCSVTLTGKDVTPPNAFCQNVTVFLDANGNGSITPAQVNNGSTDNCGTATAISVSPNNFNCLNLSVPMPPSIWINEIHYDNSGTDAGEFIEIAGTAGIDLSEYELVRFNGNSPAAAVIYNSPAALNTLSGTIPSQSNGYGTSVVYYPENGLQNGPADGVALIHVPTSTVVQLLSYEGTFTVASGQGPASGITSTDIGVSESGTLAGGSLRLSGFGTQYSNFAWQTESAPASPGSVNAGQSFPSGSNTVTLTVSDGNGNTSTCTANVTVIDTIAPTIVCQNITVALDASGNAVITASQVDNGTTDNCGIFSLSLSQTAFNCSNIGPNTVTLTATDASGNSSSCTATVTIVDNTAPNAVCQNISVFLDANGQATISASQLDNGSTDNCGVPSLSASQTTFTCADISNAPAIAPGLFFSEYVEGTSNNKYIELYNGTGATVNLANYQLRLYSNGAASPTTTTTLTGTLSAGATVVYKNSSAVLYAGTATNATAVNWNGDDAIALFNTVTGQNEDIFGRIGNDPGTAWTAAGGYSTENKTLRRKSNVWQGITVNPSGTGPSAFTTLATEWDMFPVDDVSGLGTHNYTALAGVPVTLTVTDSNGNSSSCTAVVNVYDNINPVITCPANVVTTADPGMCSAVVNYTVEYDDNCSASIQQTAGIASGEEFPVGTTVNTFVVTDASGNTATCSFSVVVSDTEAPTISGLPLSFSACNPVMWTAPVANDNCSGVTLTSNYQPGDIFPSGTTTVTYTATDLAGLTVSGSFDVTLLQPSTPAISITSSRDYNNICAGENITLTLNGGSLGDGAEWVWYSGSCGGTPVASGVTSITVSPATTTTYFVRAEGDCNNTACVQLTVAVSTAVPTGSITYSYIPAYGAPGVTDSIMVNPVAGATYYRWFTNNGQINGVLFNNQLSPVQTGIPKVDVTFVLPQQNYQIRVMAGNACGRSSQANTHIRGTVAAPASLTGPSTFCPGVPYSYTVSAITPVSGNSQVSYNWTLIPAGAGTISGTGLTRTIVFNNGYSSAQVCVNGVSSFGLAGPSLCITVNSSAPAPGAITGNTEPCQGSSGQYSIAAVAGATNYIWSTTIGGAVITPTANPLVVDVTFPSGSFSGNLCVAAEGTCGTSTPTCLAITSGAPGDPGVITGPSSGVCGENNVSYSLSNGGALNYSWTLPAGASFSIGSPTNTSSISVDFASNFAGGDIGVVAQYTCGNVNRTITVTGAPAMPTLTPMTICANTTETYVAYSDGAQSYNWNIQGANSYSMLGSNSYEVTWGPAGGSLSVTATNTCGTSPALNVAMNCRLTAAAINAVSVYPNPTSGKILIEYSTESEGKVSLMITDLSGRQLMQQELNSAAGLNHSEADLSHYESGVYLLHLRDGNGNMTVKRIVVE